MPNSLFKDILRSYLPAPRSPQFHVNQAWDSRAWRHHLFTSYHFLTSQVRGGQIIQPVGFLLFQHALRWWIGLSSLQSVLCTFIALLIGKPIYRTLSISRVLFFSPKIRTRNKTIHSIPSHVGKDLKAYEHEPLKNKDCLRLLLLKGGRSNDELRCDLLEFSSDTVVKYEALSYVWGPISTQHYIICNEKRISITENCDSALRHLRPLTGGRVLWVDSICINQDETNPEKVHQLQLMGHIYSRAEDVLIWLGLGTPESDVAFKYITFLAQMAAFPTWLTEKLWYRLYNKILQRGHEKLVLDIASREWFTRVWTLQEMALARPFHIIAICGKIELNYEWIQWGMTMAVIGLSLEHKYRLNNHNREALLFRTTMRSMISLESDTIKEKKNVATDLLRRIITCRATNPKDMFYSMLEILEKLGVNMPYPDYKKSVGEIYHEATTAIIEHDKSLGILDLITGLGPRLENAPSWVPDFSQQYLPRVGMTGKFKATGKSKSMYKIATPNEGGKQGTLLLTHAAIVDRILDCSPLTPWRAENPLQKVEDGPLINLESHFIETIQAFEDWYWLMLQHSENYRESDNPGIDIFTAFYQTIIFQELGSFKQEFAHWLSLIISAYAEDRNSPGAPIDGSTKARLFGNEPHHVTSRIY